MVICWLDNIRKASAVGLCARNTKNRIYCNAHGTQFVICPPPVLDFGILQEAHRTKVFRLTQQELI